MFTVCSKCNLRLTVTAQDLRAAQGYVRCGRCHNVFNALAALADDPARQAVPASTADTQQRPVLTQPEPPHPEPPHPEPSMDAALEFNPASTNINEVFIEATPGERTGTFESIVLVGEDPAAEPTASDPDAATGAATADAGAEPAAPEPEPPLEAAAALEHPAVSAADQDAPGSTRPLPRKSPVRSRSPWRRRCWAAARPRWHACPIGRCEPSPARWRWAWPYNSCTTIVPNLPQRRCCMAR